MFIEKRNGELWAVQWVTLRHPSGDSIRRFKTPQMLVAFLRNRPRTNYFLEGVPDEKPLLRNYIPRADDILLGQIWFDPDQNKIVTN